MILAGQIVPIRTTNLGILNFTVLQLFEPFTLSVALLARCPELSSDPVVLKIFDTRYMKTRILQKEYHIPDRPWTVAVERQAAQTREAIARGELEDMFDETSIRLNVPEPEDAPAHARWAADWEEDFYRSALNCFKKESTAYQKLHHLQGSTLPRFLGDGVFIPPSQDSRSFEPPAIFLEYIHGPTLSNTPPHLLTPALYKPLVDAVDSFHEYGVTHIDLHEGHILVSPPDAPTRMVVIDFGHAEFRREGNLDETDEEWKLKWQFRNDDAAVREQLKQKDIHVPFSPEEYRQGEEYGQGVVTVSVSVARMLFSLTPVQTGW